MEYEPQVLDRLRKEQLNIFEHFITVCDRHGIPYFAAFGTALGAVRHHGYIPWDDDLDIGMLRADYEKFLLVLDEMGKEFELVNPGTKPDYTCSVTHIQKKGTKFLSEDDCECTFKKGINMDIFVFDSLCDDENKRARQFRRTWLYGRLLFLCGNGTPHFAFGGVKKALCIAAVAVARFFLRLFRITGPVLYKKLEKESVRYNGESSNVIASFCSPDAQRESFRRDWLFPLKETRFEHLTVKIPFREDLMLQKQYGDYMELPPIEHRVSHRPAVIDFGDESEKVTV